MNLDWTKVWTFVSLGSYVFAFLTVPSILLRRQGRPISAVSWVLLLFAFPLVGLLSWWLLGRRHLERHKARREKSQHQIAADIQATKENLEDPPEARDFISIFKALPEALQSSVFPPTSGNRVKLLIDAAQAYPAMKQAIRDAQEYIHFLFYIWQNDAVGLEFRDLLVYRAKAGVKVRVLVDSLGSSLLDDAFLAPMRDAGVCISYVPAGILQNRPTLNFRNHRKILIVDGIVAFGGGLNIGIEYTMQWRDIGLKMEGPIVDQYQEVFVDDWYFATGESITDERYFGRWRDSKGQALESGEHNANCGVIASGPHLRAKILRDAFFTAITSAKRRVWLITPYFIPDYAIMVALQTAVYRGVDCRLLVPGLSDVPFVQFAARSYYETLLEAGLKIYEYQAATLHAKALLFDDDLSIIGSANIDIRSFRLNFEVSTLISSKQFNKQLGDHFLKDCEDSKEISLEQIGQNSSFRRLLEAIAHLLSPLL
ncbi:MAG: cardiolipin synthase [Planctomycetota bacterium]|nr:cardiolipin synthase [Planctomycetota bacterium]